MLARRRPLAALLAGVAVAAGIHAAAAPPLPSRTVLVAAHDLAAGSVLEADDVEPVELPSARVPSGVVSTDSVGRTLASPLRRGEPVTDLRLVGPTLLEGHPGLRAVPVRLPDAGMVALLTVGDRIDLVSADPQGGGAVVVAADVLVLALPQEGSGEAADTLPGRLVVIGAPADVGTAVADAAVNGFLTLAFSR